MDNNIAMVALPAVGRASPGKFPGRARFSGKRRASPQPMATQTALGAMDACVLTAQQEQAQAREYEEEEEEEEEEEPVQGLEPLDLSPVSDPPPLFLFRQHKTQ